MEPYSIQLAQHGDYTEIAACLAEVRGADYYTAQIYNPMHLRDSGRYKFFTAKTESGELAGSIGISEGLFDETLCVVGMLAIKMRFTGMGIGTALCIKAFEYARQQNIPSAKGHLALDHEKVQKALERQSCIPTGLLFGVRDCAKGNPVEAVHGDRRSLVIYTKQGAKQDAGRLYITGELQGIARDVYNRLGVSFSLDDRSVAGSHSVIGHFTDSHHGVLYIQVKECGIDLSENIFALLASIEQLGCSTATLLLDINHPSAAYGCELLRDMGFLFSGFDPLGRECEHIILHYKGRAKWLVEDMQTTQTLKEFINEVLSFE